MHPRSSPARREARDGRGKAPSGRTQEIQRLVGRALRAAVALDFLGERTIALDCDVLEADGGTRTASVTGSFVALALALDKLTRKGALKRPVLRDLVAATSVGLLGDGVLALDLCYLEDSAAEVDLNIVAAASGDLIELQGTAEGEPVPRKQVDQMIDLALAGVLRLTQLQSEVLAKAGVDLAQLTIPRAAAAS
jgi:ribonuclease PH